MRIHALILTVVLGLPNLSLSACRSGSPPLAQHGAHQPERIRAVRAELVAVLEAGDRAMLSRDAATLGRLFADDLVVITPVGGVMGKTGLLAPFDDAERPNPLAAIESDYEDATVQVYGDEAVMTLRTEHTFRPEIDMVPTAYRNTYVFSRADDTWQVRVLHSMRLP